MLNRTMLQTKQKEAQRCHNISVNTLLLCMNNADVMPMVRAVKDKAESITLNKCARFRVEWCQNLVTERSAEQFTTHAKMLWKQRWLKNFDIVR